ncbi:MAG: methyl-accepting chemotaxis protein [Chthoniobacterales bacterium]|nr:methyl-accepting chemotaxis protein [Chthoniobacterales bacterium]
MKFQDLSFAWKLAIGFGSTSILTIFVVIISAVGLSNATRSLLTLQNETFPEVLSISELNNHLFQIRANAMRGALLDNEFATSKEYKQLLISFQELTQQFEQKLQYLKSLLANSNKVSLTNLLKSYEAWQVGCQNISHALSKIASKADLPKDPIERAEAMIELGDLNREYYSLLQRFTPLTEELGQNFQQLTEQISNSAKQSITSSLSSSETTLRWVIAVGILAILLSILIAFIVSSLLNSTIQRLVTVVNAVANLELTSTSGIKQKDELGQLAQAIDSMSTQLRSFVEELRQTSDALNNSSKQLFSTSDQLATSSSEMSVHVDSVSAAGQQLSATMQQMAERSNDISNSTTAVASAVEELHATISEVTKNCAQENRIASQAKTEALAARERIAELRRSADQVNKVLELIQNIASQTKLLALNATIEAASAGEAGRGFTVVANEVKELARQTAEATDRISSQVAEIRAAATSSIEAIEKMGSIIHEVSSISNTIAAAVEEQSATTNEIAKNISTISNSTQELARGIAQSAIGASSVSKSVFTINQRSNNVAENAANTKANANQLLLTAERIRAIVSRFKI